MNFLKENFYVVNKHYVPSEFMHWDKILFKVERIKNIFEIWTVCAVFKNPRSAQPRFNIDSSVSLPAN